MGNCAYQASGFANTAGFFRPVSAAVRRGPDDAAAGAGGLFDDSVYTGDFP
jgi:hypothetical protein